MRIRKESSFLSFLFVENYMMFNFSKVKSIMSFIALNLQRCAHRTILAPVYTASHNKELPVKLLGYFGIIKLQ
ncbi:hypothetical protein COI92_23850 [Bacillus anthracis]|nr:hypothetical protein COI92_23850 [Bacillus anthracis]